MKTKLFSIIVAALSGKAIFAGPPPEKIHEEDSLESLKARLVELHGNIDSIRASADQENRRLSEEEVKKLEDLSDHFDALDEEIKLRERVVAQKNRLAAPSQRVVPPTDAPVDHRPAIARVSGGDAVSVKSPTWGFRSLGEFCRVVANMQRGDQLDQRIKAAATTYGNETTLADGGYALPPDFRETIMKKLAGEDSLLARTDQQFTSSNRITMPQDNTTPWQETGGIQCYWDDEGNAMTPSKPSLAQAEVKANRLSALIPVTDEMLEDSPQMSRYIPGKVAEKFISKINKAIIAGDGVAKPKGLLLSDSKVEQAIEAAQDLTPAIVFENITKMWSRLYAPLRNGAIWLINQDIEPFLSTMVLGNMPAYLPPGGLAGTQYATLMGRPVIAQEWCSAVGTPGDIILTNLSSYLTVQKVGGVRADVSMHLYFDQAITAFRFVTRIGGQSHWSAAATRASGSANTLSNIVTLGTRTA